MIKSKKKCICKKCEDCNFYLRWNMTDDHGKQTIQKKCGFFVLFEEISRIRGSVDGVQAAANEARNRSMETKGRVEEFGMAVNQVVVSIEGAMNRLVETNQKLLEDKYRAMASDFAAVEEMTIAELKTAVSQATKGL